MGRILFCSEDVHAFLKLIKWCPNRDSLLIATCDKHYYIKYLVWKDCTLCNFATNRILPVILINY